MEASFQQEKNRYVNTEFDTLLEGTFAFVSNLLFPPIQA